MIRARRSSGFTLVELLIVIVVIAILAAITTIAYNGITNKARTTVLQSDLSQGRTVLAAANAQNGTYPADQAAAVAAGLKSSNGDTLTYTVIGAGYCLQANGWTQTYYVTDQLSQATAGSCTDANPPVEDGKTLAVTGSITDAGPPNSMAMSPDGSKLYVLTLWNGDISVINTATNTEEAYVSLGIDLDDDDGLVVSPDGQRLYVSDYNGNKIYVINTATNTVATTITDSDGPCHLAISPDGSKLYVGENNDANTVAVIATSSNTITTRVSVGIAPEEIVVNGSGSTVYVLNAHDDTISAISTASNTVTATTTLDGNTYQFEGLAISPDGQKLYTTHYNDPTHYMYVVDSATAAVTGTVDVGSAPHSVAMAPDGSRAYVYNAQTDPVISIVKLSDNSVTGAALPGHPGGDTGLVISPDGSKLYIGDNDNGSITVLTWQ